MKNFILTILAIFSFGIGLFAVLLALVGSVDPEGVDKFLLPFVVIIAIVSFLTGQFLFIASRKDKNFP